MDKNYWNRCRRQLKFGNKNYRLNLGELWSKLVRILGIRRPKLFTWVLEQWKSACLLRSYYGLVKWTCLNFISHGQGRPLSGLNLYLDDERLPKAVTVQDEGLLFKGSKTEMSYNRGFFHLSFSPHYGSFYRSLFRHFFLIDSPPLRQTSQITAYVLYLLHLCSDKT